MTMAPLVGTGTVLLGGYFLVFCWDANAGHQNAKYVEKGTGRNTDLRTRRRKSAPV